MKIPLSINNEITVTELVLEYEEQIAELKKENARLRVEAVKAEKAEKAIKVAKENINRLKGSFRYKPNDEKLAGLTAYQHILSILK